MDDGLVDAKWCDDCGVTYHPQASHECDPQKKIVRAACNLRGFAAMLVSGPTKRFVPDEGPRTEKSVVFSDDILARLETDDEVRARLLAVGLAAMQEPAAGDSASACPGSGAAAS